MEFSHHPNSWQSQAPVAERYNIEEGKLRLEVSKTVVNNLESKQKDPSRWPVSYLQDFVSQLTLTANHPNYVELSGKTQEYIEELLRHSPKELFQKKEFNTFMKNWKNTSKNGMKRRLQSSLLRHRDTSSLANLIGLVNTKYSFSLQILESLSNAFFGRLSALAQSASVLACCLA